MISRGLKDPLTWNGKSGTGIAPPAATFVAAVLVAAVLAAAAAAVVLTGLTRPEDFSVSDSTEGVATAAGVTTVAGVAAGVFRRKKSASELDEAKLESTGWVTAVAAALSVLPDVELALFCVLELFDVSPPPDVPLRSEVPVFCIVWPELV